MAVGIAVGQHVGVWLGHGGLPTLTQRDPYAFHRLLVVVTCNFND